MKTLNGCGMPGARTLALAACLLVAGAARGQVPGTIVKKDGQQLAGRVQWLPAAKAYGVTDARGTFQIGLDQVARVDAPKPAPLDTSIAQVRSGAAGAGAAIPMLLKIVDAYTMIGGWDVLAARWLAEAYLKTGVGADAVKMCERVLAQNPEAIQNPEFAYLYWDALLAVNQTAKLERAMEEMIKKGTRPLAAMAQIKRGDIQMKRGDLKEALVSGYLRTAVLFRDVKDVQPEALYKATKCFEELGQQSHADKTRRKLLAEHPSSPFAEKVRSGT